MLICQRAHINKHSAQRSKQKQTAQKGQHNKKEKNNRQPERKGGERTQHATLYISIAHLGPRSTRTRDTPPVPRPNNKFEQGTARYNHKAQGRLDEPRYPPTADAPSVSAPCCVVCDAKHRRSTQPLQCQSTLDSQSTTNLVQGQACAPNTHTAMCASASAGCVGASASPRTRERGRLPASRPGANRAPIETPIDHGSLAWFASALPRTGTRDATGRIG